MGATSLRRVTSPTVSSTAAWQRSRGSKTGSKPARLQKRRRVQIQCESIQPGQLRYGLRPSLHCPGTNQQQGEKDQDILGFAQSHRVPGKLGNHHLTSPSFTPHPRWVRIQSAQTISTAERTESGDTFELFNHGSVLDDATLNRAKSLLIHEGEVRGCLRVEHFFRLEFVVGKAGRKEESFSDMDSAASNGTVLMAKLVTGLALLHLMQDKRYNVQAVCYLDEASSLDQRNQLSLIETAQDFGYALIFASPTPLVTARYCIPITSCDGYNNISRKSWQILEPLNQPESISPGQKENSFMPNETEPADA